MKSINELKNMNSQELNEFAKEIRSFLIENISKTGGHLGSNLGIVELTMAIHKNFNSPKDKIIFDVGHQCYVHKILTNRSQYFNTLRQENGLSGFIKRKESEHDVWEAGHSSTSLSAACGMALARDLKNSDEEIIAIIGDGSLTNGLSLEALNNLSSLNTKVIIILNDNEMSISNNVGFIDDILKNLQYSKSYNQTKTNVKNILDKLPMGLQIKEGLSKFKNEIKLKVNYSQNFFNMLGFDYLGPVNGHNFGELDRAMEYAKNSKQSVLIHVKTIKGNGYKPAMENNWHGVGKFDINTGKEIKSNKISNSQMIANTLEKLMEDNKNIYVITPAMEKGSELTNIKEKYPNRFTDVGIAEEHAITMAAGMALANYVPFVSIYSTFLQRSYDQIFHDIVHHNAHVVIGIDRAGIVGEDGETHQGINDIAFLSHMPNIVIFQGKDQQEQMDLLNYAINEMDSPVAIRYSRGGNNENVVKFNQINPFKWDILKENNEIYVIGYGDIIKELECNNNFKYGLINAKCIKPIDYELLDQIKDKKIIVVEEHVKFGGLNTMIKDYLEKPIKTICLPNEFIEQGSRQYLLEKYNLSGTNLINEIERLVKNEN